MVDPPFGAEGAGGMEYPTLITAGTPWWPVAGGTDPEGVVVHEFGHQYWYGMVGSNEFEESWLDEGFNTYSTGKAIDRAYGPQEMPIPSLRHSPRGFLGLPRYDAGHFQSQRLSAIRQIRSGGAQWLAVLQHLQLWRQLLYAARHAATHLGELPGRPGDGAHHARPGLSDTASTIPLRAISRSW